MIQNNNQTHRKHTLNNNQPIASRTRKRIRQAKAQQADAQEILDIMMISSRFEIHHTERTEYHEQQAGHHTQQAIQHTQQAIQHTKYAELYANIANHFETRGQAYRPAPAA